MSRRNLKIQIRVSANERNNIINKAEKSGLTLSEYMRKTSLNYDIKELPPIEFLDVLFQLRKIGNNIQQVAVKANSIGLVDAPEYRRNYELLQKNIGKILEALY